MGNKAIRRIVCAAAIFLGLVGWPARAQQGGCEPGAPEPLLGAPARSSTAGLSEAIAPDEAGTPPGAGAPPASALAASALPAQESPVARAKRAATSYLLDRWVGRRVPYRLGGNSFARGIDCSGLVIEAFRSGGARPRPALPRTARGMQAALRPKARSELRTGDLFFAATHRGSRRTSHVGFVVIRDGVVNILHKWRGSVVLEPASRSWVGRHITGFADPYAPAGEPGRR